jgi:DNA integrity scanning protein DisA with diadenylate cyclase activity
MSEQLLLFHYEKTDIEELDESLTQVIEKLDRYRKSMHAKISTLSSQVRTLEARVDVQDAQLYILKTFIDKHMSIKEEKLDMFQESGYGLDI